MSSRLRPPPSTASSRVERLVERAMSFVVEEYDDLALARLAAGRPEPRSPTSSASPGRTPAAPVDLARP